MENHERSAHRQPAEWRSVTSRWEPGVATTDHTVDDNLLGQELVRVVAHELTQYLLNHLMGSNDHRPSWSNVMYDPALDTSRDLDEGQCQEMRSNYGVD